MYTLLLLNGGVGQRAGFSRPKQMVGVHGIPLMIYSLRAADVVPQITQIVLNHPPGRLADVRAAIAEHGVETPITHVEAGATRQESVRAMLSEVLNNHVLVHESARPLVTSGDFSRLIDDPRDNVSFVSPLTFTVAPVDVSTQRVVGALERSALRGVRFPQKFNVETLRQAHRWASREHLSFTEDATLCASAGHSVSFIDVPETNFKVTTSLDVRLAEHLLQPQGSSFEDAPTGTRGAGTVNAAEAERISTR